MKKEYLAFDLGASHGRVILGSISGSVINVKNVHNFKTQIIEKEGHLFWDLESIWEELRIGFKKAITFTKNLKSISVNSWGVDFVPMDSNGEVLRNAYCYRDNRTEDILDEFKELVPDSDVFKITGIQSMPINTVYQLYWDLKKAPNDFNNTRSILTIADYFNYLFSGYKVIERSLASTSQMLNINSGKWSVNLLNKINISPGILPKIVRSGTVLGSVREYPGIKTVASCSHDTACAIASISNENYSFLSCGTWSLMGIERSNPIITTDVKNMGFTNEFGYNGRILFMKNLNGLWVLQECEKEWKASGINFTYDQLINEAEYYYQTQKISVIDLNEDQFFEPGNMIGKIQKKYQEKEIEIPRRPGMIVAIILKSLAESYAKTIRQIEQITKSPFNVIRMIGGGVQNKLLCQLTANICGCKVFAGPVEATAIGNILIQAQALSDIPSDISFGEIVSNSYKIEIYEPKELIGLN